MDVDEKMPQSAAKPVVLFDGGCPLCRREIAHYRRVAGADRLEWVDIASHPALEQTYGVTPAAAMARFHVRRVDGSWATGAYGFAEVWGNLSGYRLLATIVCRLGLLPLLDWAYVRFAGWRLRRRCGDQGCTTG